MRVYRKNIPCKYSHTQARSHIHIYTNAHASISQVMHGRRSKYSAHTLTYIHTYIHTYTYTNAHTPISQEMRGCRIVKIFNGKVWIRVIIYLKLGFRLVRVYVICAAIDVFGATEMRCMVLETFSHLCMYVSVCVSMYVRAYRMLVYPMYACMCVWVCVCVCVCICSDLVSIHAGILYVWMRVWLCLWVNECV